MDNLNSNLLRIQFDSFRKEYSKGDFSTYKALKAACNFYEKAQTHGIKFNEQENSDYLRLLKMLMKYEETTINNGIGDLSIDKLSIKPMKKSSNKNNSKKQVNE